MFEVIRRIFLNSFIALEYPVKYFTVTFILYNWDTPLKITVIIFSSDL